MVQIVLFIGRGRPAADCNELMMMNDVEFFMTFMNGVPLVIYYILFQQNLSLEICHLMYL